MQTRWEQLIAIVMNQNIHLIGSACLNKLIAKKHVYNLNWYLVSYRHKNKSGLIDTMIG